MLPGRWSFLRVQSATLGSSNVVSADADSMRKMAPTTTGQKVWRGVCWKAKKGDLEDTVAKLSSKIGSLSAASATLKKEVRTLQRELAALAKTQAEMDKVRADENAAYREAKADLELGLGGVRKATEVLQAYYGSASFVQQPPTPNHHSKASGAGGSILDILSVVESDFAKELASRESMEADAAAAYDRRTQV